MPLSAPRDGYSIEATPGPLSADELRRLDAYWRAANYLSVGQIYLLANPLLREPLAPEHVKPRLLGHWGTTPGLNFVYAHMNRAIGRRDLNAIYVTGPGHGGPGSGRERLPRRAPTARCIPTSGATRRAAAAVSPVLVPGRDPQPRRAGDARLDPRGRRARLLAAARLRRGVRQPGSARRCAWWVTVRPRPGRWRRAGTRTSSSTRRATARCCRFCISTGTRSPIRRCWPGSEIRSCDHCWRATATPRGS